MIRKKYHYAWTILLALCFVKSASMCFVTTLNGIFIAPVCAELGVSRALFTTPQLLTSVSVLLTTPFLNRLYKRFDFRRLMTAAGAVYALCPAVLSLAHHISVWYVVAVFQGAAAGILCTASVPLILSHWFREKYATALGVNGAVGSALSMLSNPLGAAVITAWGWRAMYLVCALGIGAMVLPFTAFVLRLTPADKGLEPYGGAAEPPASPAAGSSGGRGALPYLPVFALMTLIMNMVAGAVPMLADYAVTRGYTAQFGAALVSMGLGGAMVAKFLIGPLIQRMGCLKTQLILTLVAGSGSLLFLWAGGEILCLLAFACGWFMTTTSVMVPAFLREIMDGGDFVRCLPLVTMFSQLTYSAAQAIYAALTDATGDYQVMFVVCTLCCAGALLLMWGISAGKRRQAA